MKKFLLSMALVAIAGAGTQASAQTAPANAINGKFSVAADKQVYFSQGNLQYTQSTKTWSFAANQYDIIGEANITDGALADKIDLFGWSASNTTAPFGISTSTDYSDYYGDYYDDFVDWGTKTIGDDAPNTWRTLTYGEWIYLLKYTRWTMAMVNGTLGFMLLPDGKDIAGVSVLGDGNISSGFLGAYLNFNESDYADNQYTAEQFAQLEAQGCVFLPCAGYRVGSDVGKVGSYGPYWSASPYGSDRAGYLGFSSTYAKTYNQNNRYYGLSVRLVQDVKAIGTGIAEAATTGNVETRKVLRDGQILIQRGDQTYTVMGTTSK